MYVCSYVPVPLYILYFHSPFAKIRPHVFHVPCRCAYVNVHLYLSSIDVLPLNNRTGQYNVLGQLSRIGWRGTDLRAAYLRRTLYLMTWHRKMDETDSHVCAREWHTDPPTPPCLSWLATSPPIVNVLSQPRSGCIETSSFQPTSHTIPHLSQLCILAFTCFSLSCFLTFSLHKL